MTKPAPSVLNLVGPSSEVGKILDLLRGTGYDAARWPETSGSAPKPWVEVCASELQWSLDNGSQTLEGTGNLESLLQTLATWSDPR